MIEATFQEIVERMERLADEPCPSTKCHRMIGSHTPTELSKHLGQTWGLMRAVFDHILEPRGTSNGDADNNAALQRILRMREG